jgi:hypothetical protein
MEGEGYTVILSLSGDSRVKKIPPEYPKEDTLESKTGSPVPWYRDMAFLPGEGVVIVALTANVGGFWRRDVTKPVETLVIIITAMQMSRTISRIVYNSVRAWSRYRDVKGSVRRPSLEKTA